MDKLVITNWVPEEFLATRPEQCEIVMPTREHVIYSKEELYAELFDADALLIIRGKCPRELLEHAPRLRVVGTSSVGFDHIDLAAAEERGVAVVNAPLTVREGTAEKTIALMLAIMHRVPQYDVYTRERLSTIDRIFFSPCTRAFGKTLGIVGFGGIGEAVARRAAGLGMRIVYNNSSGPRENSVGGEYLPLEELLRVSDVVSLHMPLNEKTRGMIGMREISLMKPSAYLVNMARGAVVREEELIEALKKGVIAGAALDVFMNEPSVAPAFRELDNIVLSPHVGTFDNETRIEMANEALSGIAAILAGREAHNRVI